MPDGPGAVRYGYPVRRDRLPVDGGGRVLDVHRRPRAVDVRVGLAGLVGSPARLEDGVGYWRETVVSPYDRHETVYTRPNYRAGFGRTPGAQIVEITNNGYFGAARDRIPLSAIDDLTSQEGPKVRREDHGDPQGRRVATVVPHNFAIMRSGQFWHDSEPDQAQDYEESLRPKLNTGMAYLADHESRLRLPEAADEPRRRLPAASRDVGAVRIPGVLRAGAVGGGAPHRRGDLRARDPAAWSTAPGVMS